MCVDDRIRPLSYPQTDIFLVCFSVVSPTTYDNISKKWLPELRHHSPDVPFLLIGTKTDLRSDESVNAELTEKKQSCLTKEQGEVLCKEFNGIKYLECSAKSQDGLKAVFDFAISSVLSDRAAKSKKKNRCLIL